MTRLIVLAILLAVAPSASAETPADALPVPRVRDLGDSLEILEPVPPAFRCRVAGKAYDGDTWKCGGNPDFKVRGWGYDTPEMGRYGKPDEPGARAARNRLREILAGQTLACTYRGITRDRIAAQCFLPDGKDIGAVMVGEGYAAACLPFTDLYLPLERPGTVRAAFCEAPPKKLEAPEPAP